jgi:thiamine biosynthesis lipoprotein
VSAPEHELRFEVFGTDVRLLVGPALEESMPSPEVISLQLQGLMRAMHQRLTRFDPGSELSRLNGDPAEAVSVSPLLASAVAAARWAAERTGGLVDPVVVDALEAAGYERSRRGERPAPLAAALGSAPPRRPASPSPGSAWPVIGVSGGEVRRPVGTRIDLGGTAKGWAADVAAAELEGYASFAVDVGGDMRIGGASTAPRELRVEHPLRSEAAGAFAVREGAAATSGIATRVWHQRHRHRHHLIDPSSGEPAWTGLVQATALAPTALEAEALAKAAFLSGPDRAPAFLPYGGMLIAEDGAVGAIEAAPDRGAGRARLEAA